MSDWTELLSEMSTCEPPGDLTARVLGDTQRAGGQTRARLSTNIFEVPNSGGPGTLPILTHGTVRRDGYYEIIAARGRILLIGQAGDRPDAFALDRLMKAVAGSLKG
jgi:hypothetical protein